MIRRRSFSVEMAPKGVKNLRGVDWLDHSCEISVVDALGGEWMWDSRPWVLWAVLGKQLWCHQGCRKFNKREAWWRRRDFCFWISTLSGYFFFVTSACGQVTVSHHQKFHVPKMEGFLNLVSGYFGGWDFPYISWYDGEDSFIFCTWNVRW